MRPMVGTVPKPNSCTYCVGSLVITNDSASVCHSFLGIDESERHRMSALICKLTWVIVVFCLYLFDMLATGVCTTGHWQMSGRLVRISNVCTVG